MTSFVPEKLKVAFVTGGHPFDVPAMHQALHSLPGMEIYPQHMDDWARANAARQSYDVVVFYHMLMDGPAEKGKWYEGNAKAAVEELGQTAQGIVLLHHAILAYPNCQTWSDLVGIRDRKFGYHAGQQVSVTVADQQHPITRGFSGWAMVDETYTMVEPRAEDGNIILLTSEHPQSMKALAWARKHGKARVFCLQSGHDGRAYAVDAFRDVLARGIHWTAANCAPVDLPAKMNGVIFVEKGKAVLPEEPTPVCQPGHILCQTVYSGLTNGTERNVLMGGNYGGTWPNRCGYQNVGRVLEVGVGVTDYAVGDLIFSGNFRQHVQYFAQHATDPNRLVVKLPKQVDPVHAALFGMASVAMHDVRRSGVGLGHNVLVVGAGPIGQFTGQAARAAGATVTICDLSAERLGIACQLGAHHAVTISNEGSWTEVGKLGPFDVVFEDSGAAVIDRIVGATGGPRLIKRRGNLVVIGGRSRVDYGFNAGQGAELEINHASHFVRDDLELVCRFVAERVIKVGPIIRDIVPIGQAISVYDRLRDQPDTLFGVVFDWNAQ